MTITELEQRWKSITHSGIAPYRSLRISPDCIAELYVALDIKGRRYMILQVPKDILVECQTVEMQNLSIEWHEQSRFILIGLRNNNFTDLYNDLALSLYSRIKDISNPREYTAEFINSFHKWAIFFDDTFSMQLSDVAVKGIFGELILLRHYLTDANDKQTNDILKAWQGPYGRTQDFIFSAFNVEVKTKEVDQIAVHISSEYQLQPETGKDLRLAVVDVENHDQGINLNNLVQSLKETVFEKNADISIFLKTLAKAGITSDTISTYNNLCWKPLKIIFYDCNDGIGFPKIIVSEIDKSINQVKYNLTISLLENFITQRINL